MRLNVKAMGLAMGIVWAIYVTFTGLQAAYMNWGTAFVELMGSMYIGYKPTLTGSLIGGLWGFVDGTIVGLVVAWVYNKLAS